MLSAPAKYPAEEAALRFRALRVALAPVAVRDASQDLLDVQAAPGPGHLPAGPAFNGTTHLAATSSGTTSQIP